MPCPSQSFIKERLNADFDKLIDDRVTPWVFLLSNGIRVTAANGKMISYKGVSYEGTPSAVFWGTYMTDHLRALISRSFAATRNFCIEHHIDRLKPIQETADLLTIGVTRVYAKMIDVDRRLRGNGNPQTVKPRDVSQPIEEITGFIEERKLAEIALVGNGSPTKKSEEMSRTNSSEPPQFVKWVAWLFEKDTWRHQPLLAIIAAVIVVGTPALFLYTNLSDSRSNLLVKEETKAPVGMPEKQDRPQEKTVETKTENGVARAEGKVGDEGKIHTGEIKSRALEAIS
ncbi:MAG: hypothetical protein JNJ70_18685 [Verrucomicrobiales bacterium]|nr:hypothetical protein [Verrucomicrobiales bacterium]